MLGARPRGIDSPLLGVAIFYAAVPLLLCLVAWLPFERVRVIARACPEGLEGAAMRLERGAFLRVVEREPTHVPVVRHSDLVASLGSFGTDNQLQAKEIVSTSPPHVLVLALNYATLHLTWFRIPQNIVPPVEQPAWLCGRMTVHEGLGRSFTAVPANASFPDGR